MDGFSSGEAASEANRRPLDRHSTQKTLTHVASDGPRDRRVLSHFAGNNARLKRQRTDQDFGKQKRRNDYLGPGAPSEERADCGAEHEESNAIEAQSVNKAPRARVSANAGTRQIDIDGKQLSALSGDESHLPLHMSAEIKDKRQPGRFQETGRDGASTLTINDNTICSQAIVSRYRVRQVPVSNTPKRLRNISSSQKKSPKAYGSSSSALDLGGPLDSPLASNSKALNFYK